MATLDKAICPQQLVANTPASVDSDTYWNLTPDALLKKLSSSLNGLSQAESERKLAEVGPNVLATQSEVTPLGLFLNQFKSPIILILTFATIASALLGDLVDAVIITLIVPRSAVLSFTQEYNAGTAAEKLKAQVRIQGTVLSDGQPKTIPTDEIVPGDIVVLQPGSLIPADGVLLEGKDLFVSQSALTGETFPVEKTPTPVAVGASLNERTNAVFMGTSVRSGSGKALIVQTGKATVFGQIADRLRLRPPETEFERITYLGNSGLTPVKSATHTRRTPAKNIYARSANGWNQPVTKSHWKPRRAKSSKPSYQ